MGNQHSLDTFSTDLVESMDSVEGERSMYTAYGEERDKVEKAPALSFCFGKAAGSELGTSFTFFCYYYLPLLLYC